MPYFGIVATASPCMALRHVHGRKPRPGGRLVVWIRFASCVALAAALVPVTSGSAGVQGAEPPWLEQYREPASRLIGAALADRFAWRRLAGVTDTHRHPLSGAAGLAGA